MLSCDHFTALVHEVLGSGKKQVLAHLVRTVAIAFSTKEAAEFFEGDGKDVAFIFQRLLQFAKCICHLLQVDVGPSIKLSEQDVLAVTAAKTTDSFLKVVRSLLTTAEPEGPGKSPLALLPVTSG